MNELLFSYGMKASLFLKPSFLGKATEEIDKVYEELKNKGVAIEIQIRNEPWGDRHFAILDPNGIGIDMVRYTEPEE